MEFNQQQKEALAAVESFLGSDRSVFILKGYAGTGKTTLVTPILDIAASLGRECLLMAPTGRAAKILAVKTGREATTIHKAIYELSHVEAVDGNEKDASKVEFRFPLRQMPNARRPGPPLTPKELLIIVDESSMISSRKTSDDLFMFGSGILLDDLAQFARLDEGGKILFIGDPAQLPPVGDPDSFALDAQHLRSKGLLVDTVELTHVVRQDAGSAILNNAVKLRAFIQERKSSGLVLERKNGEVEDIDMDDIASKYCEISPRPSTGGPVIICFANKTAAAYNASIRRRYFSDGCDSVREGDRLIIVGNNYSVENRTVLNGEFASVLSVSDTVEKQYGVVYIDDGTEKKKRTTIELAFRDVELLFEDGIVVKKKIFDSLLNNMQPNITYQEMCALVSNFNMRHKDIKRNSPEYLHALMSDPFYNAIRAKYGYAITCHKAQGGEWDTTFVDFSGRTGLNKDCLRWSYTAVTRARQRMFGCFMHNIPALTFTVSGIKKISRAPDEYFPKSGTAPAGPFHNEESPVPLKAKYWQVQDALDGSGYAIHGIDHFPYRERYIIEDLEGNVYPFDATYSSNGFFRPFVPVRRAETPEELVRLMNEAPYFSFPYTYIPTNDCLAELYRKICSSCDELDITIINIVEHMENYRLVYYLKTDGLFSYLEIFFDKQGKVTHVNPSSEAGNLDGKMMKLAEAIKR